MKKVKSLINEGMKGNSKWHQMHPHDQDLWKEMPHSLRLKYEFF